MQILEDHNKQLESQLQRLRELLLQVRLELGGRTRTAHAPSSKKWGAGECSKGEERKSSQAGAVG